MLWIRGQLEAFSYQHHFHVAAASFVGDGEKREPLYQEKKKYKLKKKITSDLAGFTPYPMSPGKGHHCSAVTLDQKSKGWVLEKEKTLPHKASPHGKQGLTELSDVCSKCTEYFSSLTCLCKHAIMYIRKQRLHRFSGYEPHMTNVKLSLIMSCEKILQCSKQHKN